MGALDGRGGDDLVTAFIARWQPSGANERANDVMFPTDLCTLLDLKQSTPVGGTSL